jgi:TRAP-type C4-dicarboxylate transport system permease small subunit
LKALAEHKGVRTLTGRLLRALAAISGAVLFLIMCLVSYAVFRRYVMNDPVLGDAEIVQIGMSLVVMMAMPYATANGAHIRVDIFDSRIGAWGRFLGDLMARSVGAYILFLLIDKTWDKALDAHEYGDVTNMIEIPVWIAYGSITIGMGGYAVVLVVQLLLQLISGVRDYE